MSEKEITTAELQKRLRKADQAQSRQSLGEVRQEWLAQGGSERVIFPWALQHLSAFSIEALLGEGEPILSYALTLFLETYKPAFILRNKDAETKAKESRLRSNWQVVLNRADTSLSLQWRLASVLARSGSLMAPEHFSRHPLEIHRVFTQDVLQTVQTWRNARLSVSLLQLAWAQSNPWLCQSLVEHKLCSLDARVLDSSWPDWTLRSAVMHTGDWLNRLTGVARSESILVAQEVGRDQERFPRNWLALRKWIRSKDLDEGLPQARRPDFKGRF